MSVSRRLLRYVIPHIWALVLALLAMFMIAWCEIGYVQVLSDTIDALKTISQTGLDKPAQVLYFQVEGYFDGFSYDVASAHSALRLILWVLLAMLLLVIFRAALSYVQTYLMARIRYRVVVQLRREVYQRVTFAPLGQVQSQRIGDLLSRFIDDVNVIQSAIGSTAGMLHASITVLVFLMMMFFKSWRLTLLTLLVFPSLGYLLNRFGSRVRQSSREAQGKMADLASLFQETVFGLKVIKVFTAEQRELSHFERQIRSKYRIVMKRIHLMATMTFLLEILSSLAIAAVFGFGCWQVITGRLSIGWFIGYITMVGMIFKPVKTLGSFNNMLQQGLASAERVFRVLDFDSEERASGTRVLADIRGEVELCDVGFAYTDEYVLRHINLKVRQGEMVALVGPSGAGKTSLLNLLPRFYEVTEGMIRIDGVPIHEVTLESLRSQIAVVPQETVLFNGSVMENILYGRPNATPDEIVEAARQANAHQFICQLSDGYETAIGERGTFLSGGQQQRIAIARAILKDPRILLLDEATSSLDSESEALVQESLALLMKERTTFVIAHRLSTVIESDLIVVLDKGRIVEMGTHQALLAQRGLYQKFCQAQFSH